MSQSTATSKMSTDARAIVSDLFVHEPFIYWIDFVLTATIGFGSAGLYLAASAWTIQQALSFLVAGFALYRLASFMHEIVHFRRGEMRLFRVLWDLAVGVPMLTPSFFYENHRDHHNTKHYGTTDDGEYLPLGNGPLRNVGFFLLQVFVQPIFITLRFLLAPFTFLHPRLRRWTLEHASSFVINLRYRREIPDNAPRRAWAFIELACCLRAAAIFVLIFVGVSSWTRIPQLYFLAAFALGLNHVRTLAAHRYRSDGEPMSHESQLHDSTNITGGGILAELMFPLGLRYHALHHLFPRLPYHNLGKAHRRLMATLPSDSPYRATVYPSWTAVIQELIQNAKSSDDLFRYPSRSKFTGDRSESSRSSASPNAAELARCD